VHLQLLKAEKYSKTPLIWFTWHPTGAKPSNILDYRLVATMTDVLTRNFLLLLIHLDCTTKQRSIPFGYHISICWFRALFSVFSSLHSPISWWSRRQWVRRYHVWCTDILGGHFEHAPEICLFHWWSFYLVKSKTSSLGTTLLKCHIIRISKSSDIRAQEFCCISYLDIQYTCTIILHWIADVPLKPSPHFRSLWENC
jgi:hypothetical protein